MIARMMTIAVAATLVLGTGIDLTQTADGLPLLETVESPSGPVTNFREVGRTETAVKFGWAPMGQDAKNDVALVAKAREGR